MKPTMRYSSMNKAELTSRLYAYGKECIELVLHGIDSSELPQALVSCKIWPMTARSYNICNQSISGQRNSCFFWEDMVLRCFAKPHRSKTWWERTKQVPRIKRTRFSHPLAKTNDDWILHSGGSKNEWECIEISMKSDTILLAWCQYYYCFMIIIKEHNLQLSGEIFSVTCLHHASWQDSVPSGTATSKFHVQKSNWNKLFLSLLHIQLGEFVYSAIGQCEANR